MVAFLLSCYFVAALLHEPLGRAGGTADANGLDADKPLGINLVRTLNEVGVGIDTQAFVVEHLTIRAFASTDKEDKVVLGGKLRDVGHAVGHRAADGVERAEGGIGRDVLLDILDDAMELVERLGGLRIEVDVAREVELRHVVEMFNDDGITCRLAYQTQYLRMTFLAKNNYLRFEIYNYRHIVS